MLVFVGDFYEVFVWLKCIFLSYMLKFIKIVINRIVEILKRFYYFNVWFVIFVIWNKVGFYVVFK